jgi:transcriptional regulator with GAF, ATPase, and Fis domain
LLQRLLTTCLIAAKGAADGRVRASYYRAHPRQGSKKERLQPEASVGRNISATSVFEKGTKAGNEVFRRLSNNETTFESDTSKIEPSRLPGWNPAKKRDYKTFISVPVRGEDSLYGMLTLDSTEVGDLTEYDEMYVRCIGLLLASGIAIASPE